MDANLGIPRLVNLQAQGYTTCSLHQITDPDTLKDKDKLLDSIASFVTR